MGQARDGAMRGAIGVSLSLCGAILLATLSAVGADGSDVRPVHRIQAGHATVNGNLLGPVRRQLSLAFRLAQESIQSNPACSALFGSFGTDGRELLAAVEFNGALFEKVGDTCGRNGVAAFTEVKSKRIRLCPGFAVLSVPAAALILIHEVLHSAGLSEKPLDPNGLTPQEINRLVAVSCFH